MIKKILMFQGILITGLFSFSQTEWAPIGTKWYYNRYSGINYELTYIETIGDTLINSKICNIFKISDIVKLMDQDNNYYWDTIVHANEYLYFESNIIYHYDIFLNYFYVLYNFSAQPYDTITVRDTTYPGCIWPDYYCSTFKYIVDSISVINISNFDLVKIYTRPTDLSNWAFSSQNFMDNYPILENIGSTKYFFGSPNIMPVEGEICCLRCYIDSNIIYISNLWSDTLPCNYLPPLQNPNEIYKINSNNLIQLYPNPITNNYLYIKLSWQPLKIRISLFDIIGNELFIKLEEANNEIKINFENINSGVFILNIQNNSITYNYLIIKQ
ncbi:MAG: T9SS type A sorting domain-containing protein [Bacteroidia bacterium]|nr:T9SS type A sorting domain-containing protein [Bacteroidia bacterium]